MVGHVGLKGGHCSSADRGAVPGKSSLGLRNAKAREEPSKQGNEKGPSGHRRPDWYQIPCIESLSILNNQSDLSSPLKLGSMQNCYPQAL